MFERCVMKSNAEVNIIERENMNENDYIVAF